MSAVSPRRARPYSSPMTMRRISPTAPTPRRRLVALGAGALLLLATPATPAVAQSGGCQGAPGSSAVEQYCEAIPRGDGGRSQAGGSGSGNGTSTISKKTGEALADAGADGASIARLAQDGSAPADSSDGKSSDSGSSSDSGDGAVKDARASGVAAPKDASGSPLKAATEAAQTGSTVGPALAWGVIGMSALGAISAVLIRRRKGSIPPPDGE